MIISDDEDDLIVIDKAPLVASTKKKAPKPRRAKSTTKKNAPARRASTSMGALLRSDHSDPSCALRAEWAVDDKWNDEFSYKEHDTHLHAVLDACDRLRLGGEDNRETLTSHVETIVRNVMSLCDRAKVEREILRQTVADELYEQRTYTAALLERLRKQDAGSTSSSCSSSQMTPMAQAMQSVLQVHTSLRGIYPHISYAHAHAGVSR